LLTEKWKYIYTDLLFSLSGLGAEVVQERKHIEGVQTQNKCGNFVRFYNISFVRYSTTVVSLSRLVRLLNSVFLVDLEEDSKHSYQSTRNGTLFDVTASRSLKRHLTPLLVGAAKEAGSEPPGKHVPASLQQSA
jgi:hypothetical protein